MRKIIVLVALFISSLSPILGQEKHDTEESISGGFQHDSAPKLRIFEINQTRGGYKKAFSMNSQSVDLSIIGVYTIEGKKISSYTVYTNCELTFTITAPSGIYFIKVGETTKILFLSTGAKFKVSMF